VPRCGLIPPYRPMVGPIPPLFTRCPNCWCGQMITDEYLLNYLLKKYKLDKTKLIASIMKAKHDEMKMEIMRNFYMQHHYLIKVIKPMKEHYRIFREWCADDTIDITKADLESYYENYGKQKIS
jgi:hypothetical protein